MDANTLLGVLCAFARELISRKDAKIAKKTLFLASFAKTFLLAIFASLREI
jgi:hypothetical protein